MAPVNDAIKAPAVAKPAAPVDVNDTIKPIQVKTIKVKLTQTQTAGLGPIARPESARSAEAVAEPAPVAAPKAPAPKTVRPLRPSWRRRHRGPVRRCTGRPRAGCRPCRLPLRRSRRSRCAAPVVRRAGCRRAPPAVAVPRRLRPPPVAVPKTVAIAPPAVAPVARAGRLPRRRRSGRAGCARSGRRTEDRCTRSFLLGPGGGADGRSAGRRGGPSHLKRSRRSRTRRCRTQRGDAYGLDRSGRRLRRRARRTAAAQQRPRQDRPRARQCRSLHRAGRERRQDALPRPLCRLPAERRG